MPKKAPDVTQRPLKTDLRYFLDVIFKYVNYLILCLVMDAEMRFLNASS